MEHNFPIHPSRKPKEGKFTDTEFSVFEFLDRYTPLQGVNPNNVLDHAVRVLARQRGDELHGYASIKSIPNVIFHEIGSFTVGLKECRLMFVTTLLRHWQCHANFSYLIWAFSWLETGLLAVFLVTCFHYDPHDTRITFYHQSMSIGLLALISFRCAWSVYRCLIGATYASSLRQLKINLGFQQCAPIEVYSDVICVNNTSARDLETLCQLFESEQFFKSFIAWILARNIYEFLLVLFLGFGSYFQIWFLGTYGSFLAFVGSFYLSVKTRFKTLLWPVLCFMLGEHMLSTMQLFDLLSRTMVIAATSSDVDSLSWGSIHESFWMSAHFLIFIIGFILTILCHFAFFIWPVHVQKGAIFFILFWDGMMGANTCLVLGKRTMAWGCFVFGAVLHLHIAIQFLVEGIPIFWLFPDDEVVIIDPDRLTLTQWIVSRYKMFFCYNARCSAAVVVSLGDDESAIQFRL